MKTLEEKIDMMDYTFKTWFRSHVKWIKEAVCYISADKYFDEDTLEDIKHVIVIVATYSKKNPYEVHSTFWKEDKIISSRKATFADIDRSLCLSNIFIPRGEKSSMVKKIYGLVLSNFVESINIQI